MGLGGKEDKNQWCEKVQAGRAWKSGSQQLQETGVCGRANAQTECPRDLRAR